jgi:hypothetical protein
MMMCDKPNVSREHTLDDALDVTNIANEIRDTLSDLITEQSVGLRKLWELSEEPTITDDGPPDC